jgi:hypothetical protein
MRPFNMQSVRIRVDRLADACRCESGPRSMTLEDLVAGSRRTTSDAPAADDSKWVALMGLRS